MAGFTMHSANERDLRKLGGLARQMPVATVIFSVAGLGSLGLPMTSGFAAEFITFGGSFASTVFHGINVFVIVAALGVVLSAGYILWMIQRVFYGPVQAKFGGEAGHHGSHGPVPAPVPGLIHVHDADALERVYMFTFVALIILIGVYPALLTDLIKIGIAHLV
jgi:NADH-quinone oxidoreductase subunit M